jgi:hypothetical protein
MAKNRSPLCRGRDRGFIVGLGWGGLIVGCIDAPQIPDVAGSGYDSVWDRDLSKFEVMNQ